jgi:hypothetical protein
VLTTLTKSVTAEAGSLARADNAISGSANALAVPALGRTICGCASWEQVSYSTYVEHIPGPTYSFFGGGMLEVVGERAHDFTTDLDDD